MTIEITHQFLSEKADSPDSTLIQPSNWNDTHTILMAANALIGRGDGVGQAAATEITMTAIGQALLAAATTTAALAAIGGAAAVHTHTIAQITNLQTTLNAIQADITALEGTDYGDGAFLDKATAANYWANVINKLLTTDQIWTSSAEVTIPYASPLVVDMATFINAKVTLTGNPVISNPVNPKVGQSGLIRFFQDGVGGRAPTFGTNWEFAGAIAPSFTSTAGAKDLLFYHVQATDAIFASLINAVN